jgi:uncharacterized protein YcfL
MVKIRMAAVLLAAFALSGCTSITNLTPRQYTRRADGLYPFELQWNSRQQSIVRESLKPTVLIEGQTYPMELVQGMTNRWETMIAIPATEKLVNYRFRMDYEYYDFGKRGVDNRLSSPATLTIKDK